MTLLDALRAPSFEATRLRQTQKTIQMIRSLQGQFALIPSRLPTSGERQSYFGRCTPFYSAFAPLSFEVTTSSEREKPGNERNEQVLIN